MKPMNKRTLTIAVLAIIEFLIMAIIIGLFVMGRISDMTFWTALIVACLAIPPIVYLATRRITDGIKSPQEQAAYANDDLNLEQLFVPRTLESTIFEFFSIALLITAWYIILSSHGPYESIRDLAILTIAVVSLLVEAYLPVNSFFFGKLKNLGQVQISTRLKRTLAAILATYAVLRTCACFNTPVLGYVFLGITVLTFIVFRVIQHKAR